MTELQKRLLRGREVKEVSEPAGKQMIKDGGGN